MQSISRKKYILCIRCLRRCRGCDCVWLRGIARPITPKPRSKRNSREVGVTSQLSIESIKRAEHESIKRRDRSNTRSRYLTRAYAHLWQDKVEYRGEEISKIFLTCMEFSRVIWIEIALIQGRTLMQHQCKITTQFLKQKQAIPGHPGWRRGWSDDKRRSRVPSFHCMGWRIVVCWVFILMPILF
jgi:hypothetical protein